MPYSFIIKTYSLLLCLFIAGTLAVQNIALAQNEKTFSTAKDAVHFRVETVAIGLEIPWSMAFAPDGRLFVTERPGRLRVIENGVLRVEPVATIEDVKRAREAGLMGLALHPNFAENHWLYMAYAYQGKKRQLVRVARYREVNNTLVEPKTIIEDIPAANYHAGCRIKFGPDRKLYITTGEATEGVYAQQLDTLYGKTLRLNDDGTIPGDNPFVSVAGARAEIFSYGHRNSQGLDWQPSTGKMFQTEHGPTSILDGLDFIFFNKGGDEINIVEKGKNYGWPIIHHDRTQSFMEKPFLQYTPAVAPAGATFYRGSAFPQFQGNFFFANLKDQSLIRLVFNGEKVPSQERLLKGKYGRIRDVVEAPDGSIYFCTSNRDPYGKKPQVDDRIMRIVPEK